MTIGRWRGAVGLSLALSCWFLLGAQARADQQIDAGSAPVVNVHLSTGTLTVQTWDKPQVRIQSAGSIAVQHLDASEVHPPKEIPIEPESVTTDRGTVDLPSEMFALPQMNGSHQAVFARGSGNTTITVPRGTAMVTAHVRQGQLNLNGYQGTFVASVHKGGIALDKVNGTGFVQALDGPISASNSTFSRLRARTTTGDLDFRGCTAHQIQATSQYGSILYDNGRFQPGLAHFESEHGNVAIGVRGGAQIGAQSTSGHVVSSYQGNGRGPVVTAASHNGSVYLYNGSAAAHPRVQAELRDASGIPHFEGQREFPQRQYGQYPGREAPVPAREAPAPPYGGRAPQYYYPPRRFQPQPGAPPPPRAMPHGPPQNRGGGGNGGGHQRDRQPPF